MKSISILCFAVVALAHCALSLAESIPVGYRVIAIKPAPTSPIAHTKPGDKIDICIRGKSQTAEPLVRDVSVYSAEHFAKTGVILLLAPVEVIRVLDGHLDKQHRLFLKPSNVLWRILESDSLENISIPVGYRFFGFKFVPTSPVADAEPGDKVDIYIRRRDDGVAELLLPDVRVIGVRKSAKIDNVTGLAEGPWSQGVISVLASMNDMKLLEPHFDREDWLLKPSNKHD